MTSLNPTCLNLTSYKDNRNVSRYPNLTMTKEEIICDWSVTNWQDEGLFCWCSPFCPDYGLTEIGRIFCDFIYPRLSLIRGSVWMEHRGKDMRERIGYPTILCEGWRRANFKGALHIIEETSLSINETTLTVILNLWSWPFVADPTLPLTAIFQLTDTDLAGVDTDRAVRSLHHCEWDAHHQITDLSPCLLLAVDLRKEI